MCIMLDLSKKNNFSVYHNGTLLYSETYSIPQMLSVCDVVAGDVVEVKLSCSSNQKGAISISAAVLDEELFRQCYDVLNASTLELTHFENTYLEGTIQCDRSGILYTSIPQDGNWTVLLDGNQVEPTLIGDVMIGIPVTEGSHTVTFTYHNTSFGLGWRLSLICLLIFLFLYYLFLNFCQLLIFLLVCEIILTETLYRRKHASVASSADVSLMAVCFVVE